MNNLRQPGQCGATLVELLIGVTVGLLVATGALSMLVVSVQGHADNIRLARLNQDLRAMMDIMVRDIRRAGFATDNPEDNFSLLSPNPFFNSVIVDGTTDIAIHDYQGGYKNCIVYSYNYEKRNAVFPDSVYPKARFGFRLEDSGELKIRSWGCTNENCDNIGECKDKLKDKKYKERWATFTDPGVKITDLEFMLSTTSFDISGKSLLCTDKGKDKTEARCAVCEDGSGNNVRPCLVIRWVDITLTGELRHDSGASQTLKQQVRIRNDLYLAASS